MAHELEIKDGQAQMAYAGETPWHGLGTQVDPDLTPVEMMKAAGLDWTVSQHPLYAHLKHPETGEVKAYPSRKFALVRDTDNEILTETSERWKPTQNQDAFEFFNKFHKAGARMETAGSLFNGRKIWGLARLGADFRIGGKESKDVTNGYLLFSLPHELGSAIKVRTTSVRVVCNNTLSWSLQSAADSEYSQSHVSAFDFDRASEIVDLANQRIAEQGNWTEKLLKINFTEADAARFFAELISEDSLADFIDDDDMVNEHVQFNLNSNSRLGNLLESYHNAPGATPGTGYGVLNGVTHFVDHVSGRESQSRLNSAWYGVGQTLKTKAVRTLEEMGS